MFCGLIIFSLTFLIAEHPLKDKMRLLKTPLSYQYHIMGHAQDDAIADGDGEGDPRIYMQRELEWASQLTTWGTEAVV